MQRTNFISPPQLEKKWNVRGKIFPFILAGTSKVTALVQHLIPGTYEGQAQQTAGTVIISRRAQLQTEDRHDGTHCNVNNIAILVIASRTNTQNFMVRPPEFSAREAKDLTRFELARIYCRLPSVSVSGVSAAHCSRYTTQTELRWTCYNDTKHKAITEVTLMAENVTSRASVLAMLHLVNGNTYIHTYTHTLHILSEQKRGNELQTKRVRADRSTISRLQTHQHTHNHLSKQTQARSALQISHQQHTRWIVRVPQKRDFSIEL